MMVDYLQDSCHHLSVFLIELGSGGRDDKKQ
jgi:hypothetical protein